MGDTERRKNAIVKLTNKLLTSCSIAKRVVSVDELSSDLFVSIYENVCASELVDKILPVKSIEDEIHNVQAVVDSISLDILHEDLSHITGEAVVNKDLVSIEYLLDILISIQEWLTSRVDSSNSNSDVNDTSANSTLTSENENNYENAKDQYRNGRLPLRELDKNSSSGIGSIGQTSNENRRLLEKEKQIENLKLFLDTSQSSIEMLVKAKEKTDEQIRYMQLEKQMEKTVRMTQNALANNLPPSLANLTNSITSSVMMQAHQAASSTKISNDEAAHKKQINDDSWFNLIESEYKKQSGEPQRLSTSSSFSGIGVLSDIRRKKEEIIARRSAESSFEKAQQQRKGVRFDDGQDSDATIDSSSSRSDITASNDRRVVEQDTTNELSIIRNTIKDASDKDNRIINLMLKSVYEEDLKDAEALLRQSVDKVKGRSEMTNNLYKDAHRPGSAASVRVPNKGVFIAHDYQKPLRRPSSASPSRHRSNSRVRYTSSNAAKGRNKSKFVIGDDGILSKLLEEFPYLYLAPETIHELWQKHSKQIEGLQRQQHELETKYSKENENTAVKKHLTETHNKQKMLMDIMRKEIEHMQRVQDLKRKQNVENVLKSKARDQRFQNVKIKNYFEEFRLQQRAKMLKKLTKEEVLFKKLFNESLKIQKERLLEMKKYAKEQRDIKNKQQLNHIESIENFYKNKFSLLNEEMKKEKTDNEIREKAQHEILTKMKSQLRSKLETDIRDLQDQLVNDEDYLYWRQLDANRAEQDLKLARYKAYV